MHGFYYGLQTDNKDSLRDWEAQAKFTKPEWQHRKSVSYRTFYSAHNAAFEFICQYPKRFLTDPALDQALFLFLDPYFNPKFDSDLKPRRFDY